MMSRLMAFGCNCSVTEEITLIITTLVDEFINPIVL